MPATRIDTTIRIKGKEIKTSAYQVYVEALDNNVKYHIKIEYDGNSYESTPSKPLTTPEIDNVSCILPEHNEGDVIVRISTHDNTEGAKFFMWNYVEDWIITARYSTTIFYRRTPPNLGFDIKEHAPFYYCERNVASNKPLIVSTESLAENRIIDKELYRHNFIDDRFTAHYSVIVYQKAISKEAYEYYQNVLKLNEEMGGLFTPQPSEIKGNITCTTDLSKKVIGYIEVVKNTTHKRIFVDIEKAGITRPQVANHLCELVPHEEVIDKYKPYDYYDLGYRPAGGPNAARTGPTHWTHRTCTDCRERDGTKPKTDFWPDTDNKYSRNWPD
jgi:hypothetical protein